MSPEEAAAKAGADFISKLPNGLNTVEGPEYTNGFGFSGGQRQQIAASRVLCRKPKILFADEPTASLDAEHESVLTAGLTSNDRDCTVIYISHRFRTLLNADKILVLNEGRLEAVGTHDQLMQDPEGTYARNYRLQSE